MKKIFFILLFVIIAPFLYDTFFLETSILQKKLPFTDKSTQTTSEKKFISFENHEYAYYLFSPSKNHQLIFNINLLDKKISPDILKEQKCAYLINGGFYDKEDEPIGLVIKDGLEISPSQKNSLFNGYVSATNSAEFSISTNKPSLSSIAAIQTGPILVSHNKTHTLSLKTDEYRRRMVLIITSNNTPIFMTITFKENEIEGPLLSKLPELLNQISTSEKFKIKSAINLDGGSASAFHTPDTHINELTTIGSYFCFK